MVVSINETVNLISSNKTNPNFVILDVRSPKEYKSGHIENAININYFSSKFTNRIDKLDKNKTYLIYCHSGVRSGGACNKMKQAGFENIHDFAGGFTAWKKADQPISQ